MTGLPVLDAPADVDALDDRAVVALLHRVLHRAGFDDGTRAGHLSLRRDDGSLLLTPHHRSWAEVRASDVAHVDEVGTPIEESPAVARVAASLHRAVHEARPDVRVAVHNHPPYATVWAAAGRVPPVYDQLGALVPDDLVLYDEFDDNVATLDVARRNVEALGDGGAVLLANHGVLLVARSIREAHLRCIALEHRCRLAWKVEALGGGRPVPGAVIDRLSTQLDDAGGWPYFLESALRHELTADPTVLS